MAAGKREGEGGRRPRRRYPIQDFLRTTNFTGASFSPNNSKVLVSSDETGVFNAYAIPVAGGRPIQLTDSSRESVLAMGYFPEDERFLYMSDEGGNELHHVYVHALDGSFTDLTPGEGLKANFEGWATDDASFFVSTNERDQRFFDLYEIGVEGYERRLFFQNEAGYRLGDVSPDRRYLLLSKVETNADGDIYLYDGEADQVRHLTPHGEAVNYFPLMFSPDGASFYFLTDEGAEFLYLVRYDLEGDQREVVERVDWDIMYARLSKQGTYLVLGVNEDARTELRLYETATMQPVRLPRLPDAEISSVTISADERHLAFYASSSRMPQDLFVTDLAGAEPRQLTHSLNPNIDPDDLVDGQGVRFASYDDLEIPGVLYQPHQASREAKAPALVWVHGGPGGQSRIGYNGLVQYLVNHGYLVYAINNRGSSGYGKTFFHMDDRKHGDADLGDCVSSKQMLIDTGLVDPERIGIIDKAKLFG